MDKKNISPHKYVVERSKTSGNECVMERGGTRDLSVKKGIGEGCVSLPSRASRVLYSDIEFEQTLFLENHVQLDHVQ